MRPRQLIILGGFIFLILCAVTLLKLSPTGTNLADFRTTTPDHGDTAGSGSNSNNNDDNKADVVADDDATREPEEPSGPPSPPLPDEPYSSSPKPAPAGSHPMQYLISEAEREV